MGEEGKKRPTAGIQKVRKTEKRHRARHGREQEVKMRHVMKGKNKINGKREREGKEDSRETA